MVESLIECFDGQGQLEKLISGDKTLRRIRYQDDWVFVDSKDLTPEMLEEFITGNPSVGAQIDFVPLK